MAYRTSISKADQACNALEIFIPEGGGSIVLAMNSASAVELLIECAGRPIRRISRPDNMNGRPVRTANQGSTPIAGAVGGNQD